MIPTAETTAAIKIDFLMCLLLIDQMPGGQREQSRGAR
jgi:hypothetical protein